jgi:hypothetical protein
MTDINSAPTSAEAGPQHQGGPAGQAQSPSKQSPIHPSASNQPLRKTAPRQAEAADADEIADAVLDRIGDKVSDSRGPAARPPPQPSMSSVDQAIALREQAPEMYDLWLKIAKDKAATANYVERAPYEVPERLAQSGRPRALGALVIVLSFCGYLAWLGGAGLYIGGLIAILDLAVMFGMFFGLRPERLPDPQETERRPPPRRRLIRTGPSARTTAGCPVPPCNPWRGRAATPGRRLGVAEVPGCLMVGCW